jgi:hypothetical protein
MKNHKRFSIKISKSKTVNKGIGLLIMGVYIYIILLLF